MSMKLQAPQTVEDWNAVAFEATQLFTPSTPIDENDLFAGRATEIRKLMEATLERGKHAILFGERGVGKTSLAKVFHRLFPTSVRHIFAVREQADPADDFTSLWRKVFKDIHVQATRSGRSEEVPLAEFRGGKDIAPDDVRRELEATFRPTDIPVLIIDEYDKVGDKVRTNESMANTIKSLSDYGVNATILLVGVADNLNDLLGEHPSVARCLDQIFVPRMNVTDSGEILDKIIPRLGMTIAPNALWKIVNLSKGLPAYVHSLGLSSTESAVSRRSTEITESDVAFAVSKALDKSRDGIAEQYAKAVHSNRPDNLYKEVLLACALAETDADGRGTFTPAAVCKSLSQIRGRQVKIDSFHQHLRKFITDERGNVLVRRGRERAFRFRFSDPMMQPFVIMQNITQGLTAGN